MYISLHLSLFKWVVREQSVSLLYMHTTFFSNTTISSKYQECNLNKSMVIININNNLQASFVIFRYHKRVFYLTMNHITTRLRYVRSLDKPILVVYLCYAIDFVCAMQIILGIY